MCTQCIWLGGYYLRLAVTAKDVVARFEVGEIIGAGGFAIVRKARDRKTGKTVAIKEVDKRRYATDDTSEREIRILSKLSHRHCIHLHAVYVTARKLFIITELASGGELHDRVTEKGAFSEPEAAYVLKQVLEGVAYLHSKGIVHRDLKLENLLLANTGLKSDVKIADFGLSKVFARGTTLTTMCGSPQYMAPEVVMMEEQQQEYSPAVDIWSVGVILFILLSGYSPFDDENDAALFEKIKTGQYNNSDPVWDTVSDGAKDLVAKMLTVDAEERLSAEECLQNLWLLEQAEIMDNLPDDAPAPPLPQAAALAVASRRDNRLRAASGSRRHSQAGVRQWLSQADSEIGAAADGDWAAETGLAGSSGRGAAELDFAACL